jgi:hypothetical protein
MERRDHIMDQLSHLGRILKRVMELLELEKVEDARGELTVSGRLMGVDLEQLAGIVPESLLTLMTLSGPFDAPRARTVGELLRADSIVSDAEGNELRATGARVKSLWLLLRCVDTQDYIRRPEQRQVVVDEIDTLVQRLGPYPFPARMADELRGFMQRQQKAQHQDRCQIPSRSGDPPSSPPPPTKPRRRGSDRES